MMTTRQMFSMVLSAYPYPYPIPNPLPLPLPQPQPQPHPHPHPHPHPTHHQVLSAFAFGHALHPPAYLAAALVFGVLFYRIKRGRRA